ncbi:MAG: ATP synthase F0 subunit C [Acidaminococcales bacterium]|nr:ATP synthase F0 subunit C [Acidaminococcales bacterium]
MEQTIIIVSSAIGAAIICFGAAIAAAFGNSLLGRMALESMTRQPELADKILINSLIYMGLIEAVPIIGIVIAIILVLANPFV